MAPAKLLDWQHRNIFCQSSREAQSEFFSRAAWYSVLPGPFPSPITHHTWDLHRGTGSSDVFLHVWGVDGGGQPSSEVSELGQALHGLSEAKQRAAPALWVSPGDCSFQHYSLESEASGLSNNPVIWIIIEMDIVVLLMKLGLLTWLANFVFSPRSRLAEHYGAGVHHYITATQPAPNPDVF